MKSLRIMMVGFVVTGAIVLLSSASFADEAQDQAKIRMLNDAAVALVKSNPDLAQRLTKFALQEATEKVDKNEVKKEPEGIKEEGMKKERVEHIKLLRDSAATLKQSQPELALSLLQMADRSEKKMMNKEAEEKNEKEDKDTSGKK
jgi:hypothetical protein